MDPKTTAEVDQWRAAADENVDVMIAAYRSLLRDMPDADAFVQMTAVMRALPHDLVSSVAAAAVVRLARSS